MSQSSRNCPWPKEKAQHTVSDTTRIHRGENVILVPVGQRTSLSKECRWKIFSKCGVVNVVDVHVIKYLDGG